MKTYSFIRFYDRNIPELIFMIACLASIPLTIVGMFIVLKKSPPQMCTYKWIIFNFTLTTFFTDITICFLYDPVALFPQVACYSTTWLANVGENANYMLLCISLVMLQLTLASTLIAFIYRMRSLLTLSMLELNGGFMKIVGAIYLVSLAPVIIPLVVFYRPRSDMEDIVHKTPELKVLENYNSYLAVSADDIYFIIFQILWLCSAFAIVAACIVATIIIVVILHRRKLSMSRKSLSLHRSLVIHLIIQITIPVATTLIPVVVLLSTRYIDVPFGADFWNPLVAQAIGMHSPLNVIAVLLSTRHYRIAFIDIFRKPLKLFFGSVNLIEPASDRSSAVARTRSR